MTGYRERFVRVVGIGCILRSSEMSAECPDLVYSWVVALVGQVAFSGLRTPRTA
jgi:hypothetical protein